MAKAIPRYRKTCLSLCQSIQKRVNQSCVPVKPNSMGFATYTVFTVLLVFILATNTVKTADPCVINNHRHANKFINVYSNSEVDALWVNLTVDDERSRETTLQFHVKFDYSSPMPLLENVMVNNELLCAAGGQPAVSATAGILPTRIPTLHKENRPSTNPIR